MRTLFLKSVFLLSLTLALSACGKKKSSNPEYLQNRTFSDKQAESRDSYNIQLRGQDFSAVSSQNSDFLGLAPTKLSASIRNAKYENSELEIRLGSQSVVFPIELHRGLRFNILDNSGRYSVVGSCIDTECAQMAINLEDIDNNEVVELLYSRSYEYLTNKSSSNLSKINNELLKDAILYKYPVARHSIRVNNSRDLDLLVIERPQVDSISEDFSIIVDGENNFPALETPPQRARGEQRRLELDSSELISVTTSINSQNDELILTRNIFEAYDLQLPATFFSNDNSDVSPLEELKEYAPAHRLAIAAKAMVERNVKIDQDACNIYVRTALSMAGYNHYGHYVLARNFDQVFRNNNQGLQEWEHRQYDLKDSGSIEKLQRDLMSAEEFMGMVMQVDKTSIGAKNDHIGVVVIEDGDIVMYDASLNESGPRRKVLVAENLLNSKRPIVNLYSYPLLINSVQ